MVSIELSDETYRQLQSFVKTLQPYATRFGLKVTAEMAISEALAIGDLMYANKDYMKGYMGEQDKDIKERWKKFQGEHR